MQDCLACENHAVSGNALRLPLGLGSAILIQSLFQCPLEPLSKRFRINVGAILGILFDSRNAIDRIPTCISATSVAHEVTVQDYISQISGFAQKPVVFIAYQDSAASQSNCG